MRPEEREHVRIELFVESGAVKPWGVDADFGYGIRKRRPARDQKGEVPGVADDMGFMPIGQVVQIIIRVAKTGERSRFSGAGYCA